MASQPTWDQSTISRETNSIPDFGGYYKRVLPILFLMTCCFFLPAWLQGKAFIASDILKWNYPFRASGIYRTQDPFLENEGDLQDIVLVLYPPEKLAEQKWRAGEFPLWDPRIGCGYPIHAINPSSMLHPVRVLSSLIGGLVGRGIEQFLCVFVGASGMGLFLVLLRHSWRASVLGSAAWVFGGMSIGLFQFSGFAWANSLLPVCLCCVTLIGMEKRWGSALLALSFGVLILGGSLQNSFFYGLLLAAYCFYSLRGPYLLQAGFSLLLGCLVGLPTLWGQLELVSQSSRLLTDSSAVPSKLTIPELGNLLYPFQFGAPWESFYLGGARYSGVNTLRERCCYLGIFPTLLACLVIFRRKHRFWTFIVAATLIYSLGTWFTAAVQAVFPPLKSLVLTRILQVTQVGLVVLAAEGWDNWFRLEYLQRRKAIAIWAALMGAAALPFMWNVFWATGDADWIQQWAHYLVKPAYLDGQKSFGQIMSERLVSHFVFLSPLIWLPVLTFLGLCITSWYRRCNLTLAITLADLLIYSLLLNVAQPAREIYPELPALASLPQYRQTFPSRQPVLRSAGWIRMAHANSLSYYGFCDVAAYQGMLLQDYQTLLKSLNADESAGLLIGLHAPIHYGPGLADLLGVGFHYSDPLQEIPAPFAPSSVPKNQAADWNVAPWRSAKRAYLVGAARRGNKLDVLKWLLEPGFDPRRCIYITDSRLQIGSPEPQQGEAGEIGTVEWELYDTSSLALNCTSPKEAWLLINDTYFKGWEATVDGQPVPLLVADYAFRAVELTAGRHRVAMEYRPKSIAMGLPVALLSSISLMIAGWLVYRKDRLGHR